MAELTQKLKNQARREEQRENWSAAIELYSRALRHSEKNGAVDVSLYNRIGDIYLRLDDLDSAVGYYERAIVRYADQELYTSAIALCNKVLRVLPSRISAYLQLGRLQLETGLAAEARVNYLRYATELLTRGQSEEAHAALEEYVVRSDDLNSALRFAGALVANDRGEEALSLLERIRGRLDSLGRDTASLERPIAAIRGFDRGGTAVATGAGTARAASEIETREEAGPTGEAPPESETVSDLDGIGALEAELDAAVPVGGTGGADAPGTAPAGAARAGEAEFSDDAGVRVGDAPDSVEVPEEVAPESVDGVETERPEPAQDAPEPSVVSEEAGARLAEPEAPELAEADEGRPRVPPEAAEISEPAPAPSEEEPEAVPEGVEGVGATVREPADRPGGLEPEEVELPPGPDAPEAPRLVPDEAEERDEVEPSRRGSSAPPPVEPEEAERPAAVDRGPERDGGAGEREAPEEPARPGPEFVEPDRFAPFAEPPDPGTLAPAARGDVRFAGEPIETESAEGEVPSEVGPRPAPLEAHEGPSTPGTDPGSGFRLAGPEAAESDVTGSRRAVSRSGAEPGRPGTEGPEEVHAARSADVAGPATALPTVELCEAPDEVPATAVDREEASRRLRAARELMATGEHERAVAELEAAAGCASCYPEARRLLEECRLAMEPAAETEKEAQPPPSITESAGEPASPEPIPDAAVGPAESAGGSWLLASARSAAEAEAGVGAERDDASEPREPQTPGGRPPDEPFRLWLAAAPYDVLKRALEELERREELQRALCVVERMLEIKPEEPSLHRVRIAHAAELGRDEVLPQAYMALGGLLERTGDLPGARGAYERVGELDPERPGLDERMEAVERRMEEAGLRPGPVVPADVEDEEAEEGTARIGPAPGAPLSVTHRPGRRDGGSETEGESRVQVYRGVVQDLERDGRATKEPAFAEDWMYAERGEGSVDFDVILAELKDQLAEKVVDEPDGRSRTEVGERLMEMGLLDDAIRELQAAVRGPDAPPRAFELLGRAFVEKGQPRVALRLLEEAVERLSGELEEERLLGVLYQLGVARQESEEPKRALECYERIFSVDIDYRDVRERIEACAA